jgi:hypothetical protein
MAGRLNPKQGMMKTPPNRAFNPARKMVRPGETPTGEATPQRQAARKRESYLAGAEVPAKGPTIYPPLFG